MSVTVSGTGSSLRTRGRRMRRIQSSQRGSRLPLRGGGGGGGAGGGVKAGITAERGEREGEEKQEEE